VLSASHIIIFELLLLSSSSSSIIISKDKEKTTGGHFVGKQLLFLVRTVIIYIGYQQIVLNNKT
jgi:hypothetical protein